MTGFDPTQLGLADIVFDAGAVRTFLDYEGGIVAVRNAMIEFSADGADQPLRQILKLAPAKLFGVMPGTLPGTDSFGAKLVSVFDHPDCPGRSTHAGVIILFDGITGAVQAVADGGSVTEIRTGCASAVATDALARSDAKVLALFGCGVQAASHLRAISKVRDLEQVVVWARDLSRATDFAVRMSEATRLNITVVDEAAQAAAMADIICTVSGATDPILFGRWVKAGTHINVVGSSYAGPREVDSDLVVQSRYYVDSRRSVLAAGAEFLVAREAGLITDDHILGEIGDVLRGAVAGRRSRDEVTIYKSLGLVVQDLAAVRYLQARAVKAREDNFPPAEMKLLATP